MAVHHIGRVVNIASQDVRILTFNWQTAPYFNTYLGLIDGWRSRILLRYFRWLEQTEWIRTIMRWEMKWLRIEEGQLFPKWSFAWFLASPYTWLNKNGIVINEQELRKYEDLNA